MTMITAPELEIAVLVLGMAILLVEAFVTKIDKRVLAFVAIAGLALVLAASFFVVPGTSTSQATGFWSFYTADRLSIFFKQFALVTTIFVLILMTDYAPVVRNSFPGAATNTGTDCCDCAVDFDLRKSRRFAADEPETATSLLEHRARRLFADRRSMFRLVSHRLLPRRIPAHDAA